MPKINFSGYVVDLDGTPIEEKNKKGQMEKLTFKAIATTALLAAIPNDNPPADEKLKRWLVAKAIHDAKDGIVEMTIEEMKLLKDMAGKVFTPMFYGQMAQLLEK